MSALSWTVDRNEVERADLQFQIVQKIFHDYFRYTQETANKARNFICKMLLDNNRLQTPNKDTEDLLLTKIRSTPFYWQERKGDLMAALRYIGKPTFFLTYSPNEIEWMEMLLMLQYSEEKRTGRNVKKWTVNQIKALSKRQREYLLASNPTAAVKMILQRHQLFKRLIWNDHGILGQVEECYTRIEFQMKGSPHFHILLWIKDAPTLKEDCEESKKEVVAFIDKHITCSYNHLNTETKYQLATQIHYHTWSCEKAFQCRYRFPIPPMLRTTVLKQKMIDDYTQPEIERMHLIFLNFMRGLEQVKTGDTITTEDWLKLYNLSEAEYILILELFRIRDVEIMLKRTPGEKYINKYNEKMQLLWNGNMDLQFVTNEFACALYIASYITKGFREMSHTKNDHTKQQTSHPPTNTLKHNLKPSKITCTDYLHETHQTCYSTDSRLMQNT